MKRILLIFEDIPERGVLSRLFQERGWQVSQAPDVPNAVAMVNEHPPTAIVWDLQPNHGTRRAEYVTLRAGRNLTQVRIVTLSHRNPAAIREQVLQAGADECLTKLPAPEEVLQIVESLVNMPREVESPGTEATPAGTTLRFWGVRGSIPVPGPGTLEFGGNTSCLEVRADGDVLILDAGSGIRPLGHDLANEFKMKPLDVTLLVSHTHWDHIQGFPFFLPAYDRKNHIRILGYEGARDGLTRMLAMQMEGPYFPIDFKELPSHITVDELNVPEFQLGQVKVKTLFTNHPGVCLGFRLETRNGVIVYLPDNEPCYLVHPQARKQVGELPNGVSAAKVQEDLTLEFARGADVLIMDSQYDARQYKSRIGWGHGCMDDVVSLAVRAEVKRLYLFHHDPDNDDIKIARMVADARLLAQQQQSPLIVEGAREQDCCKLIKE